MAYVFTKLVDNWDALTEAEKLALFESTDYEVPTIADLKALGKFKVLTLSDIPEQQTLQLKAAPKAKLVLPRQLTSIDSFEKVQQVKAAANVSVNASCRILVTTNLKDYYTYDALEMQWGQVDITGEITGDVWINAADITSIPTAAWDSLLKGKAGVGFAYLLEIEETTDHCDVDRLELIVDAKGSWEKV